MSVYVRRDSKYFWFLLERPGKPPIKESSKILHDGPDATARREQRRLADEAYRVRMNTLAKVRYELPVDRQTIGFAKFAEWFETHHLGQRKGAAREREILARLKTYFSSRDLTLISRQAVQEYISARLAETVPRTDRAVSPNTVNREVDVLKAVLRAAVPRHLDVNPLLGMKRLRTSRPKKGRTITPAEERRLLKALKPADRALYIVATDTLIRLSNVLNLRWSEVRRGKLVLEDSKTGHYDVPLSTRAQGALKTLPRHGPYCFPDRRTARQPRDQRGAIRRMLQRACARAKIPYGRAVGGITWHTATRATGATRMLRDGIDLRIVQKVGNWADIRSAQSYLESDSRAERRAVNQIGRRVTGT